MILLFTFQENKISTNQEQIENQCINQNLCSSQDKVGDVLHYTNDVRRKGTEEDGEDTNISKDDEMIVIITVYYLRNEPSCINFIYIYIFTCDFYMHKNKLLLDTSKQVLSEDARTNTKHIPLDSGKKVIGIFINKKCQISLEIDLHKPEANANLVNSQRHIMLTGKSDEEIERTAVGRKQCSDLMYIESETIEGETNNERKQGVIDSDYKNGMLSTIGT